MRLICHWQKFLNRHFSICTLPFTFILFISPSLFIRTHFLYNRFHPCLALLGLDLELLPICMETLLLSFQPNNLLKRLSKFFMHSSLQSAPCRYIGAFLIKRHGRAVLILLYRPFNSVVTKAPFLSSSVHSFNRHCSITLLAFLASQKKSSVHIFFFPITEIEVFVYIGSE